MTKQEAFDKMVAHLANQGKKCTIDGRCSYRGPNGTKCVVGCMISDEAAARVAAQNFHQTGVDQESTWNMLRGELALEAMIEPETRNFYRDMQQAHDVSKTPEDLQRMLVAVAVNYRLDGKSINTITHWA